MDSYARPMDTNKLALRFLTTTLSLMKTKEIGDHIQKIVAAEKLLKSTGKKPTLSSTVNRHVFFQSNEEREKLRCDIFEDLITLKRVDDEQIKLGHGGGLPKTELLYEGKAYLITGLPASGKSTIANKVADHYGACVIDSDYAKRKFPEFCLAQGASLVHTESSQVTNGDGGADYEHEVSVYEFMTNEKANIVIPTIGYSCESVRQKRERLLERGYEVHLILVNVDRKTSTLRALERFIDTERYVPLALVFDGYSNDPTLTYYRVREDSTWKTVGKLSTEDAKPAFVCGSDDSPAKVLYG